MRLSYLPCGKIINTHGFRGTVKAESWCDSPDVLAGLAQIYLRAGEVYRPLRVLHASVFKQFVILELDGIMTIEEAEDIILS